MVRSAASKPMMHDINLSIIIVNYNTPKQLLHCLWALRAARADCTLEVIVVDNASRGWDAADVRRAFPEVRIIEGSENTGFSAASNSGFRLARGRHVMTLNPDAEVQPGVLGCPRWLPR